MSRNDEIDSFPSDEFFRHRYPMTFPQTRILVTHGVGFLPQVDKIVVMVNGQVTETGSFEELLIQNGAFADFLRNYSDLANSGEGGK